MRKENDFKACIKCETEREKNVFSPNMEYKDYGCRLSSKIKTYIEHNFRTHICLDKLAEQFFVDKYYMCHIFKKKYGYSIINYVLNLKMEAAKAMLEKTDDKIAQIAFKLGFCSVGHFSSQFSKRTGINPSGYRALRKNNLK